jgi:subtilisin family serine protease
MSDDVQQPEAAEVPLVLDGAGVRVALVDSGVEPTHPWLAECDLHHMRVARDGKSYRVVPDRGGDQSGHGTACAGIIHRMVPQAQLTSVRALGPDGRCSRAALLRALEHCIRARFQVVNLSLGIDVPRKMPLKATDHKPILSLYELADLAATAGVILVASGPNAAAFRTYPGRFKSLVGVGRGSFSDLESLRTLRTSDHEIVAPGTDILAPALGGGERRWSGTSFATPFVAGHAARIIAARPGVAVEVVKASLHRLARYGDEQALTAADAAQRDAEGSKDGATVGSPS